MILFNAILPAVMEYSLGGTTHTPGTSHYNRDTKEMPHLDGVLECVGVNREEAKDNRGIFSVLARPFLPASRLALPPSPAFGMYDLFRADGPPLSLIVGIKQLTIFSVT